MRVLFCVFTLFLGLSGYAHSSELPLCRSGKFLRSFGINAFGEDYLVWREGSSQYKRIYLGSYDWNTTPIKNTLSTFEEGLEKFGAALSTIEEAGFCQRMEPSDCKVGAFGIKSAQPGHGGGIVFKGNFFYIANTWLMTSRHYEYCPPVSGNCVGHVESPNYNSLNLNLEDPDLDEPPLNYDNLKKMLLKIKGGIKILANYRICKNEVSEARCVFSGFEKCVSPGESSPFRKSRRIIQVKSDSVDIQLFAYCNANSPSEDEVKRAFFDSGLCTQE